MTIPTEAEFMAALMKKNDERLAYLEKCVKTTLRLCAKSGLVEGYDWMKAPDNSLGYARKPDHRAPPLPFYSFRDLGSGHCRVCGQPIYGDGEHQIKKKTDNRKRTWHSVCVTTHGLMTKPPTYSRELVHRQGGLCEISGHAIGPPAASYISSVDVDHRFPLYRVAREHADEPWFKLLRFWLLPNLRAITPQAHKDKNAEEARHRATFPSRKRVESDSQGSLI